MSTYIHSLRFYSPDSFSVLAFVALIFFFFSNWSILAFQCCVSFFCTVKYSYKYTYTPSIRSLPPSNLILPIQVITEHLTELPMLYRRFPLAIYFTLRFPGSVALTCQCRRHGFDPRVRKILWRGKWQPTQYSYLGNLMGRGAWQAIVQGVAKELDTTYN